MPTTREPLTGAEFVRLTCELAGRPDKLQVASVWTLKLMVFFMPVLRENDELMYQFEYNYRFDSNKMQSVLDLLSTPYSQGINKSLGLEARTMINKPT